MGAASYARVEEHIVYRREAHQFIKSNKYIKLFQNKLHVKAIFLYNVLVACKIHIGSEKCRLDSCPQEIHPEHSEP